MGSSLNAGIHSGYFLYLYSAPSRNLLLSVYDESSVCAGLTYATSVDRKGVTENGLYLAGTPGLSILAIGCMLAVFHRVGTWETTTDMLTR